MGFIVAIPEGEFGKQSCCRECGTGIFYMITCKGTANINKDEKGQMHVVISYQIRPQLRGHDGQWYPHGDPIGAFSTAFTPDDIPLDSLLSHAYGRVKNHPSMQVKMNEALRDARVLSMKGECVFVEDV